MSRTRQAGQAWVVLLAGIAVGCDDPMMGLRSNPEGPALAAVFDLSSWDAARGVEDATPGAHHDFNTEYLEGCPFTSRDGTMLFMASNRPGGLGGIDIWLSKRSSADEPWGEPLNVGAPVNSAANDFCPTLARDGHTFYFVSSRPGGYGGTDIYVTRLRAEGVFDEPQNLGAAVNSAADEASPLPLPDRGDGPVLYFSSIRVGGFAPDAVGATAGDSDIYRSEWQGDGFRPAELVSGVNTAFDDGHPNVRRDGLEIVFYSNRPGGIGSNDLYAASRSPGSAHWSTPVNLGAAVNSPEAETRPSLSWDGTTLYFGSTRTGGEGASDIYVTTRRRSGGE